MGFRKYLFIGIVICTLSGQNLLLAQDSTALTNSTPQEKYEKEKVDVHQFDHEKWKRSTKNLDYREKKKKEKDKANKNWGLPSINPVVLKFTLYGVVILLLLLLFIYLVKSGLISFGNNKKFNKGFDIEDLDDDLSQVPLDEYFEQARKEGNYRLLIRLYYLKVLQKLTETGRIDWRKYKTNAHYLREMNGQPDYDTFKTLTREAETAWFGPEEITKAQFDLLEPHFMTYLASISAR